MNQSWESIGIVIAILMVIMGLVILLKKPRVAIPPTQDELPIDPLSQQPIVPRHLRQFSDHAVSVETPVSTAAAPSTVPQQQKTETNVEAKQETAAVEQPVVVQAANLSSAAENIAAPVTVAGAGNPVAVSDAPLKLAESAETQTTTTPVEALPESHAIDDVESETVSLQEKVPVNAIDDVVWDSNSDVLDAHLNEQIRSDEESALATAEQLLALYLYPNPQRALSGERTLKVLLKYGLRFGEMSCFHRYEHTENASPLMFSVLRINNDGDPTGFDLETLASEEVKGLAFFLALPNKEAVKGFDMMVSLAGLMARDIDGMVFDEQSLELTPQLRDHWRHYVIEYKKE